MSISHQPPAVILEWRPFTRNTLRGFFSVELASGLVLHGCALHIGSDSEWIGLPSAPQIQNGVAVLHNGKIAYRPMVEIPDRARRDAFNEIILEALREHPDAGENWKGQA